MKPFLIDAVIGAALSAVVLALSSGLAVVALICLALFAAQLLLAVARLRGRRARPARARHVRGL